MTDYIILMPLLILIFGLTPIVARDSYLNKNQKNIMLWIIGLIGVLIAQNVADYVLQTVVSMPYLRTLESIVGYSVRPVIIILFCKLVKPNGKYRIAWILAIYNAAVYFTATFSRFAFYIDESNHFHEDSCTSAKPCSSSAFFCCFTSFIARSANTAVKKHGYGYRSQIRRCR